MKSYFNLNQRNEVLGHPVNSLKITKTPYSVLTKMRYERQNWMQGWDNGKIAAGFIKLANKLTNEISLLQGQGYAMKMRYPCVPLCMSKGYLQPLVFIIFIIFLLLSHFCMQIYACIFYLRPVKMAALHFR